MSFVVVVWISGMLLGWLIEAKQLTILKGISNFFFLLYHLWYVYAIFRPCSWIGTSPYTKCLWFKGENVQIAGVREKRFKLRVYACSLPSTGDRSNIILGVPRSNHKEQGKFKDNVIKIFFLWRWRIILSSNCKKE